MRNTSLMCGVTENEEVRRRFGVEEELSNRVDWKDLKWFGHVECMCGERFIKLVYKFELKGKRAIGRPFTNLSS